METFRLRWTLHCDFVDARRGTASWYDEPCAKSLRLVYCERTGRARLLRRRRAGRWSLLGDWDWGRNAPPANVKRRAQEALHGAA